MSNPQPKNAVFLHGYGGDGGDHGLLERDCPVALNWSSPASPRKLNGVGAVRRCWWYWDLPAMERRVLDGCSPTEAIDPTDTPRGLPSATDAILGYVGGLPGGVPGTVLLGHSQGACAAMDAAVMAPRPPAALVLMSPGAVSIDTWLEMMDPGMKDVPVLITHGRRDGTLPVAGAEWLAKVLDTAGADVTFIAFRGGHQLPPIRLLHSWLKEKVK